MIKEFEPIAEGISSRIEEWEPKLLSLSNDAVSKKKNSQNRSIKQIVGHMVDSASNNTHRVVHLQYQETPYLYPNYATFGNNDRWISIQNYQDENWEMLVQIWKYSNLHYAFIIQFIDPEKLENEWIASPEKNISLKEMVIDYLQHLNLHLAEISELLE
ncbi:MAG: DinB family protein [Mariniphaga sp.]|nr:DinB family protein [Mariniphaga sp.]